MFKKLSLIFLMVSFIFSGCAVKDHQKEVNQNSKKEAAKGTLIYQNSKIHGFKMAPNEKQLLIVIDDAIVIYDLKAMKPIMKLNQKGIKTAPENILWSPDSKRATLIFTGELNRMIFVDLAKGGQIYDLYAKDLTDLAWVDNANILYKVNGETEAIFKIKVFTKEPQFLTAIKPGEEQYTKMLLVNGYHGFILKRDDKFFAVSAENINIPKEIANLNYRHSKGLLTRSLLLEDKNENGILLRKYAFIKYKEKSFVYDNSLTYLDTKGKTLTPEGERGKMLGPGLIIKKKDGSIVFYNLKTDQEKPLPGNWSRYAYKLQSEYWSQKSAILLKEKEQKNNKQINTIRFYKF